MQIHLTLVVEMQRTIIELKTFLFPLRGWQWVCHQLPAPRQLLHVFSVLGNPPFPAELAPAVRAWVNIWKCGFEPVLLREPLPKTLIHSFPLVLSPRSVHGEGE